jgi:hypothetical protein
MTTSSNSGEPQRHRLRRGVGIAIRVVLLAVLESGFGLSVAEQFRPIWWSLPTALHRPRACFDPDATLRYSGYVGWRGTHPQHLLSKPTQAALSDAITYDAFANSHALVYPIPGEHGTGPQHRQMNYVWYRNVAEGPDLNDLLLNKRGTTGLVSVHPDQVQDRYIEETQTCCRTTAITPVAEVVVATEMPYIQVVSDVRSARMAQGVSRSSVTPRVVHAPRGCGNGKGSRGRVDPGRRTRRCQGRCGCRTGALGAAPARTERIAAASGH